MRETYPYPEGLKVGDFVQGHVHFADVYFEVKGILRPSPSYPGWSVLCHRYDRSGRLGDFGSSE